VLVNDSGVQADLRRSPVSVPVLAPRRGPDVELRPSQPAVARPAAWARTYSRALGAMEALFAAVASGSVVLTQSRGVDLSSASFWAAAAVVVAWPVLLMAGGAHSERVFGTGSDEYRAVGRAGFVLLAVAGFVSYAADLDLSRALVVVAVPGLMFVTLLGRTPPAVSCAHCAPRAGAPSASWWWAAAPRSWTSSTRSGVSGSRAWRSSAPA
jgi:hypothetical protein